MNIQSLSRKAGIVVSTILFFFILVPSVFAVAHKQTAVLISTEGTTTAQGTPTADPTLVALNKEQLTQQIQQIQLQNDRSFPAWFWSSNTALLTALAALVTAYLVFLQWKGSLDTTRAKDAKDREHAQDKELKDRQDERAKEAEERFQKVVEELGNEKEEVRVGGVILLHTFLEPGYEQFYRQVFRLAVAYLRLQPSATKIPLNELSQALIGVFVASLQKVRDLTLESESRYLTLNATSIRLDYANLREADLGEVWMAGSSLQSAVLRKADFSGAQLEDVDLTNADLANADLTNADLLGANPEKALSLSGTKMSGVVGLTEVQQKACKEMGAIFEEMAAVSEHSPTPK